MIGVQVNLGDFRVIDAAELQEHIDATPSRVWIVDYLPAPEDSYLRFRTEEQFLANTFGVGFGLPVADLGEFLALVDMLVNWEIPLVERLILAQSTHASPHRHEFTLTDTGFTAEVTPT